MTGASLRGRKLPASSVQHKGPVREHQPGADVAQQSRVQCRGDQPGGPGKNEETAGHMAARCADSNKSAQKQGQNRRQIDRRLRS